MWRNYLAAAIHNLFRDRAYAAINIFSLALGFAAAILIGLYVRDEFSYDRMYPHAGQTYRLAMDINGATRISLGAADERFGPWMKLDYPEVQAMTRLGGGSGYLKHGDVTLWRQFSRADPNFFQMFPVKALAGDPNAALAKPHTLVITRRFAQELFGREDVVGQPVEFQLGNTQTLQVGAVIENLPSNTHFRFDVVESTAGEHTDLVNNALTYVRLRPGTDIEALRASLPAFVKRHVPDVIGGQPAWKMIALSLVALPDVHFLPPSVADMTPPSDRRTVDAFVVIGLLILFVASSNFVSMMTARAARRAVEVAVRKTAGATRQQIAMQFMAECLFYSGLALGLAIIAVELLLPGFNGFLQRTIAFDYVRDPALGLGMMAVWLCVSVAAGAYPAVVLSMFRPATVLKGLVSLQGGPGRVRQALVVLQFAMLVALIVATATIHRQTRFALEDQLRVPRDQIFVMQAPCALMAFQNVARLIPGVQDTACTSQYAMGTDRGGAAFVQLSGGSLNINAGGVDTDFFAIFGIKPLAGRLFDDRHGEDNMLRKADVTTNPSVVLNESAARVLGYSHPQDAVGKTRMWSRQGMIQQKFTWLDPQPSQIIGVVPDFTAGSIRSLIEPTAYFIDPQTSFVLVLKLDGRRIPETLRAVNAAWKKTAGGAPMVGGQFLDQMLNATYADILRQTTLLAAFSAVAIVVAALGLLGLAVFTAERRTHEIGLRKVMGASRSDILRFIGWQFARPVLLANLLAWPFAWFFMRRWLEGFAYHINLGPVVFLLASALAMVVALATISSHAMMVARAKPAQALRYE
ncbi:MAG TPA: ABC transporter permease [Steroidobacteraceae bacterium]|nr:ABC transporter permease [Steroidobacteraceae bacterium]